MYPHRHQHQLLLFVGHTVRKYTRPCKMRALTARNLIPDQLIARRSQGPSKPDKAYEIMLSQEQRIPAPRLTVITPSGAPLKDSSISLTA